LNLDLKTIHMKKLLLLGLALSLGFLTFAQQFKLKSSVRCAKKITSQLSDDPLEKKASLTQSTTMFHPVSGTKRTSDLAIITLGTSANGFSYGFSGGNRSILWADDHINSVINIHRMGPGTLPANLSGFLAIDKSTDIGATFTNNLQVYSPASNLSIARFPQGAIYNPVGNTDPAKAYTAYFAPCLDSSNASSSWGGYALGVANLGDNADNNIQNISSRPADGIYQFIPDGMTVTQTGDMWGTDLNSNFSSGSFVYGGGFILTHGVFDANAKKYNYTQSKIELPGEVPADNRIAFSPDGQTGWLVALGNLHESLDSCYYPILWKTIDGGQTWSAPIEVILTGANGMKAVQNYLTDTQIAALYLPPLPSRDRIAFTTAFDCDMVVDSFGNPHIAVIIGPRGASGYSIVTPPYVPGIFDITTPDGGTTWAGQWIRNIKTFRHTFTGAAPAPYEDNRIQASVTMNGTRVFISWIETVYDDPTVTNNDLPDIFCVGINTVNHAYTNTVNVTEFSDAWLAAFCANASHYVFTDNNKFTIPYTYEVLTGGTLDNPVTYKYISNFSFTEADFANVIGIEEQDKPTNALIINPAYPNPTSGLSVVKVNLEKPSPLSLAVYSLTGKKVFEQDLGIAGTGVHDLTIDCSAFNAGIYFYTVKAGETSITRKLVVK
jgi:hypothetical protein